MKRVSCIILLLASGLGELLPAAMPESEELMFFESKIRPLLVEHCLKCHGEKKQEGGLRLDSKAGWQRGGDRGPAVRPADIGGSLIIQAVHRSGEDLQMPPKRPLSPEEIAALEKWVLMGAPDPRESALAGPAEVDLATGGKHWAFQPVVRYQAPQLENDGGYLEPLDQFVRAKFPPLGLKANPPATRRILIRRATFDLTGLPPTREEIQNFEQDVSPHAFEKVVDRLLASPAYGERWARHWLDVARYADTAGDGADYPVREASRYRDGVIDALNADLPVDQFIREQIAGDILAAKGPEEDYARRITATGFLAIGKRYGYKPSPDFQHLDLADAIDSVGRSLLGLSLGCARCHDHKYDPVSAADYYALYGIFQSTVWAFPGGEEQKRPSQFPPLVPHEEAARRDHIKSEELARLDDALAKMQHERELLQGNGYGGGADLGFERQAPGKAPGKPWLSAGPNLVSAEAQSPYAHVHPEGSRGVRVGSGTPGEGVRYVFARPPPSLPGKLMHFTIDFRTVTPAEKTGAYRFYLGRGVVQSLALEASVTSSEIAIRNGAQWEVVRRLMPGRWYTLQVSLDPEKKTFSGQVGSLGDMTLFRDKALGSRWDGVLDTFICDAIGHVSGPVPSRDLDNLGLQESVFSAPGSRVVAPFVAPKDLAAQLKKMDEAIGQAMRARDEIALKEAYPVAYGVSEGAAVNARIQLRGEPDKPGAEVSRRFLTILGGDEVPKEGSGSGRLELADWLTRPSNPLTARVFVNRVWGWHFGQGLVPTPSDFGLRGELPSHPELLDWLTDEFTSTGWSLKKLHRLIMASQTYQASSEDDEQNLKIDPSNRWLWRYSRRVADAESIRDAILAVSGQLKRQVPLPHPFPPVNTWSFTIHKPFHAVYESDHRSIYLMVQRNRRHPFLAMFDAADPNISVPQRLTTTTPTQALYLMNSQFVSQQAEALGDRLQSMASGNAERVMLGFELAHGLRPDPQVIQAALDFISSYQRKAGVGRVSPDQAVQLAWTAFGRALLTSNAFLNID